MPFRLPPMDIDERIASQRQNYAIAQQNLMRQREEKRLARALKSQQSNMPNLANGLPALPSNNLFSPDNPLYMQDDNVPATTDKNVQAVETPTIQTPQQNYTDLVGTSTTSITPPSSTNRYAGYTTEASNLSGDDLYYKVLRDRESTNNYKAVNRLGYVGAYQMGAAALIDAGLVKKGTTNAGLRNPKNWVKGMNKQKFLNSPEIQDAAVRRYTERRKRYLGDTYAKAKTDAERYAILGASHLIGASGYKKNPASVDANGVSGNDYYNLFYNQKY